MPVIGCDGKQGGTVKDVWVDRSEYIMRYLEVEVSGQGGQHPQRAAAHHAVPHLGLAGSASR